MRKLAVTAWFALAACGHDVPSSSAITGAVEGASFQSPVAFYNRENGIQVLISDDADACNHLLTAGSQRSVVVEADGSEAPSLFLEMSQGHFLGNSTRTVGDDLTANFDPGAPHVALSGNSLCASAPLDDGGVDLSDCEAIPTSSAVAGTVELARDDDDTQSSSLTDGTLDLNFGDAGLLSGNFRATPCGALHSGCGSAAGGFSFAALLALLGLRQRKRSLAS